MSLPNKFPVSHSPHPGTHISHPQHTPRSTSSSTLNPAVSFPVCLLLPTTLVQGRIAAHLDSCLPISYPFSGLCGSPLAYWTHIIENHLPPVSLRSHHSPLRMLVKAPCCLPNHIKTPQVPGCKACYQLALLYLTAGRSCPAQVHGLCSHQAQLFHLLLSSCTVFPKRVAEITVRAPTSVCGGGGGCRRGRKREKPTLPPHSIIGEGYKM